MSRLRQTSSNEGEFKMPKVDGKHYGYTAKGKAAAAKAKAAMKKKKVKK